MGLLWGKAKFAAAAIKALINSLKYFNECFGVLKPKCRSKGKVVPQMQASIGGEGRLSASPGMNGGRAVPPRAGWEIPKAWFNDTVDRALARFGKVYIVQPFREQEICSSPARTRQGISASAPAWESITVRAMMAAGLRYPTRSQRVGANATLHAGC
jgi:hypothetical protein